MIRPKFKRKILCQFLFCLNEIQCEKTDQLTDPAWVPSYKLPRAFSYVKVNLGSSFEHILKGPDLIPQWNTPRQNVIGPFCLWRRLDFEKFLLNILAWQSSDLEYLHMPVILRLSHPMDTLYKVLLHICPVNGLVWCCVLGACFVVLLVSYLVFFFVWFDSLQPSQQLCSCWDSQLTEPHSIFPGQAWLL